MATESEHFGTCLRRARVRRGLSVTDVAQRTKISGSAIQALEQGTVSQLPGDVFVRGFIRSYATTVGLDPLEPILLYERQTGRMAAASAEATTTPVPIAPADEEVAGRRGLGLAVFVIILLLIATLTLSLLLRRPPQSGELLSVAPAGEDSCAAMLLPPPQT